MVISFYDEYKRALSDKNLHLRSLNMRVPLFIPLTEQNYNPHPLSENFAGKIDLPNHKHLYPADIHKAISGAALQTWNKETRSKAFDETQGKLNIEEVD